LYRLRSGQSERAISRDLGISRPTVHKYKVIAEEGGFLEKGQEVPDLENLAWVLGSALYI
jgi:hypothetical protein